MYHDIIPSIIDIPLHLYKEAILKANNNDIICEVNTSFFGKNCCFALEEMNRLNKTNKFYSFDLFNCIPSKIDGEEITQKTPWGEPFSGWLKRVGGNHKLLDAFDFYVENCPYNSLLTGRAQFPSWQAAHEFSDNSILFCFIRTSIDYQHTRNDLIDWFRKIKKGGRLVLMAESNQEATVKAIKDVSIEYKMLYLKGEENCYFFDKNE